MISFYLSYFILSTPLSLTFTDIFISIHYSRSVPVSVHTDFVALNKGLYIVMNVGVEKFHAISLIIQAY